MAVNIYDEVADLCRAGSHASLDALMELGVRPADPGEEILWRIRSRRLRNQIDSLTSMASDLTAAAILLDLSEFEDELATIQAVTDDARESIAKIEEISHKLSKFAKILDLGLALLAIPAATASPATLAAAVGGAVTAARELAKTDDPEDGSE
ncbi:hypothetical protein [uncultured Erythrobacter sp.]|uniref:hypothetical protein n=1 Tax=uncultured Erythrobacter sp. TaxID=263913 RepID=UPI002616FB12|nr:hypothetical protein [uncultured Erythrobacter sp.]